MADVTVPPYILTDPDGSNPRIMFPVKTPAALVLIQSRSPGRFRADPGSSDGVPIAIEVAKRYVKAHPTALDRLYSQMERIQRSA